MTKRGSAGGRPRESGMVTSEPRVGILTAAASLFAEKGFASTRMAEIAQAAGLKQSSIYYWFNSKDAILRAIMDQNRASLIAARTLADRPESAAVRLYIVLYRDVIQMCSAPLNFYDLEEAATKQPEVFRDFHEDYHELVRLLQLIIDDGLATGVFCAEPASDFVRTALSLTEGSQHRFHVDGRKESDIDGFADSAARLAVRAIVEDPDTMDHVRREAQHGIAGIRACPDTEDQ
ncbi:MULTISPECIES: TetR/AcrR family transcriptional regulator [unclassified Gordonia (in: high G+C Gram-positive bacteria)]|uniref:TetR/AcrR family transcriptional regulator n=1 Tax=unclassified Gordonia (in: high G+C Gram-positive bacteria) TaxID=2657482 RepID=UPI0021A41916|nr:TetR/AcrR family transcriptional regulator [Gordonia sp. p3-SID1431]MCT1354989.1 TetR/AcrR family transcriptional regulator [Gordonia sp. p3-SID1431]